jgi:hypothetical protein
MTGGSNAGQSAAGRAAAEILLAAAVFAAAGAWPTPDVNEAVYLTKARHRADPAWCRGDFFLETPDAHGVFFAVFGPLAASVPLDTAAWIGRVLGWLAVAVGFRHAIVPLVAPSWARVVAAALFSVAVRYTPAAGEWVIGGCEAKVFAWGFVLAGLGEAVRGRVGPAWCLCGVAAAIHPIVGGWAMIAIAAAWLAGRASAAPADRPAVPWAWLAAGAALAAAGIVPVLALSSGVDAATVAAANRAYVVDRLSHHLLPRTFANGLVARHLLAIVVWWLLHRLLPATAARRRLAWIVGAAVGVALAGWLISLAEPLAPVAARGLLRFYWFRLADVLVAFALAATAAATLADAAACERVAPGKAWLPRVAVAALLTWDLAAESAHWPLPGRPAVACRADAKVNPAAWADVCAWVRDHVPADACFLTPRGSATFAWRTDRREVVAWKNSPQDPRSLVEWRRRIDDCFAMRLGSNGLVQSTATLGADRMREVADRYGATHAIVPLDARGLESLPFPWLHANDGYVVLRLDPLTAGESPAGLP